MASLQVRFGDRVTYYYHEFNQPDAAKVNRDFNIQAHPEVFILDRKGRLVQKFLGVASIDDIAAALRPLLQ